MKQNLGIGITSVSPGWKILLQQEGVQFKACSFAKKVKPEAFGCVIVNSALAGARLANAQAFLEEGGAILTTFEFAEQFDGDLNWHEKVVRFIEPKGKFFNGAGLLWLHQEVAFFKPENKPLPVEKKIGKGRIVVLPFDVEKAILETGFEKRGFHAKKAFPADFASRASKRNVRVVVSNCIAWLFEKRRLPFLHLWYYPKKFESVFSFHIDVDNFSTDVFPTVALMEKLKLKPLWFLNMEASRNSPDPKIGSVLSKQELVAQHAFEHNYFEDQNKSYRNILKGDREIKKLGINAESLSVPNGVWGKGVARAAQDLGYKFVIAFSLDHDDLPFRPVVDGKEMGFFLLPTHQICIGILKLYDFSERDMIEYYQDAIEGHLAGNSPMFFYGHPLKRMARFPAVIESIVENVNARKDVWKASQHEFVDWWNERSKLSFKAAFDGKRIELKCRKSKRASIAVVLGNKRYLVPAKSSAIRRASLKKGKRLPTAPVLDTVPEPSGFGKKHIVKSIAGRALGVVKKVRK